uniref:Uncharacterized protein n=1 Tax=Cacopsylla melanoneura TaxID=428564 RepID=A0A8D8VR22_9HEMI
MHYYAIFFYIIRAMNLQLVVNGSYELKFQVSTKLKLKLPKLKFCSVPISYLPKGFNGNTIERRLRSMRFLLFHKLLILQYLPILVFSRYLKEFLQNTSSSKVLTVFV